MLFCPCQEDASLRSRACAPEEAAPVHNPHEAHLLAVRNPDKVHLLAVQNPDEGHLLAEHKWGLMNPNYALPKQHKCIGIDDHKTWVHLLAGHTWGLMNPDHP